MAKGLTGRIRFIRAEVRQELERLKGQMMHAARLVKFADKGIRLLQEEEELRASFEVSLLEMQREARQKGSKVLTIRAARAGALDVTPSGRQGGSPPLSAHSKRYGEGKGVVGGNGEGRVWRQGKKGRSPQW